eukprot:3863054-Rhodomonas_salina.2
MLTDVPDEERSALLRAIIPSTPSSTPSASGRRSSVSRPSVSRPSIAAASWRAPPPRGARASGGARARARHRPSHKKGSKRERCVQCV